MKLDFAAGDTLEKIRFLYLVTWAAAPPNNIFFAQNNFFRFTPRERLCIYRRFPYTRKYTEK